MSNSDLLQKDWLQRALVVGILFPFLSIVSSEFSSRLKQKDHPLSKSIDLFRIFVLPSFAVLIFFAQVMELGDNQQNFINVLSTIFYGLLIIAALQFLNVIMFDLADGKSWRAGVPDLFLDLSRFILIVVGISIVLSYVWKANVASIFTALGVGSIVIGLALQQTLGNIFAGISILFERPYKLHDWVRFEDYFGKVIEINWRATRIRTHLGDIIAIPNGKIASSLLINEGREKHKKMQTFEIGFSYNNPPDAVKKSPVGYNAQNTRDKY